MQITVDVQANRVCIDTHWIEGTRRWEALVLGHLMSSSKVGSPVSVSATDISSALATRGQQSAFDRTQWRRLWASIEAMFLRAGSGSAFHARFRYPPRAKTVGPWTWQFDPLDTVSVINDDRSTAKPKATRLHALAIDGTVASSLKIATRLAVGHALWSGGSRSEAICAFEDGDEWQLATPEVMAHRALCTADAYAMSSRLAEARPHLEVALRLIDIHPSCRDQTSYADLIAVGLASFERGISANTISNAELISRIEQRSASGSDIDARTRSWSFSYIALGLISDLEEVSNGSRAIRIDQLQRAIEYHHAAIFFGIVSGAYDVTTTAVEYLFRTLVKLSVLRIHTNLTECIDCYLCAQRWSQMLEPPNGLSVIDTWLGWLCIEMPEVYEVISRKQREKLWLGVAPDSVEFFQISLNRAKSIGDPMVIALRALNCYSFARQHSKAIALVDARTVFLSVCKEYVSVYLRLKNDRFLVRVPELVAMLGVH